MRILLYILLLISQPLFSQDWRQKIEGIAQVDSVISILKHELEFGDGGKRPLDKAQIECQIANQYMIQARYVKVEKVLSEIDQKIVEENKKLQIEFLLTKGNLNKLKGQYPEALKVYHQVLNLCTKTNDKNGKLRVLIDLAEFYRMLAKYDEAKESITLALDLYQKKKLNDTKQLIRLYGRAAAIANETNDGDTFKKYSQLALNLSIENGNKYAEASILNELGYWYKNHFKTDSAVVLYKNAEEIFFSIGANREAVHAMANRTMALSHTRDTARYQRSEVISLSRRIIDTVNALSLDYSLAEVYAYIYVSHIILGNADSAIAPLHQHFRTKLEDESKKFNQQIADISEKYENDKIKAKVGKVSEELDASKDVIRSKEKENNKMLIFLITVGLLALLVVFLLVRNLRTNEQLKARNSEKDVLLKEIHHRVKNNLQIIHSLLELQTKNVDEATVPIMLEGQNRVKAMGLIHKMLYQNEDLKEVNFQSYIQELCATIQQVFKGDAQGFKYSVKAEKMAFDIDTAVPLGLIINELVTNAYKYGTQSSQLNILIEINKVKEGNYLLRVSDNGPGLPEDFEIKKSNSLGLKLVSTLSRQLGGKLKFENNRGANFFVDFKDTLTRKLID